MAIVSVVDNAIASRRNGADVARQVNHGLLRAAFAVLICTRLKKDGSAPLRQDGQLGRDKRRSLMVRAEKFLGFLLRIGPILAEIVTPMVDDGRMALLFDLDDCLPGPSATDKTQRFRRGTSRSRRTTPATAQALIDEATADLALNRALDQARALGGRDAVRRLQSYSARIAAVEAEILAEHVHDNGNTRDAERLLSDGKTSKREQRKRAKRAKAIGKNSGLASKMADGELSEEQVDVIADAADKTNGEAACDTELIDKVAGVTPEQGKAFADDYLAARATKDGIQSEHDRQRALRRASKYRNKKDGLETITLAGDTVAADAMWKAIERRANELYKQDGDRDLPASKHPRTRDQRFFDAAHELICGIGNTGAATPAARPQFVIGLTIDHITGQDPAAIATQIGLGLIPDSVLAEYANEADIIAALFDRNGQPLWLSRLKRHATAAQQIALIIRDRGCVLCQAHHTKRQAHHTTPWSAPAKGTTDLNNLALLCGPCHRRLHDNNETLFQDHNRTWQTRPATPNETPAPRPTTQRNPIQRK